MSMSTAANKNDHKAETADLTQKAIEELLKETNRAKQREETMGSLAWKECPVRPVNKRFLRNMLPSRQLNGHQSKSSNSAVEPKGDKRCYEKDDDKESGLKRSKVSRYT